MFTSFIIFLVLTLLSEALRPRPKTENARPATDFQFPTATEGRAVPIVFGTVKLDGPNVIWYGDLRPRPIRKKIKTSLFSSHKVTIGYEYFFGIQMALCRGGPGGVQVLRIWAGPDELWTGTLSADGDTAVIDKPDFFGGRSLGQGGVVGTVRFHPGTATQGVDAYIATQQSISGNTSAYRGTCYVVFFDPGYIGTSAQIKPWVFETRRIPNGLALVTPGVNSGNDANPMNVIYEIITDTEWGLGRPVGDVDVADFTAAAETLLAEGNGMSFQLDNLMSAEDLLQEIERQIDGHVFMDRKTGKWRVNLARGGYDLSEKRLIGPGNVSEIRSFSRGAWEDTTNNVLVTFIARDLDYRESWTLAQDMANIRMRGNQVISVQQRYFGVKDRTLANNISWRNLRTLSTPLARASVICDRSVHDQNVGDVVLWTDPDLGLDHIAMRISRIDLGSFAEGKIALDLVQDVFVFDTGIFSAPGGTQWFPPGVNLVPIPTAQSLVFEAPRTFCRLDEANPGVLDRIFVAGRQQGDAATSIHVKTRPNAGSYVDAGDVVEFALIGELDAAMTGAGTQGSISLTVVGGNPDAIADFVSELDASATAEECGVDLVNFLMIDNEFLAVRNAAVNSATGNLDLSNGYRGLLDSVPAAHVDASKVFLVRGGLTDLTYASGTTQNVKLLPKGRNETLAEGSATEINVVMDDRARRPYPPVSPSINGVAFATTADIDNANTGGPGTGLDDCGLAESFVRRDFRTADETASVINELSLAADFPSANTTEYAIEVRNDPAGANTLLFTTPWVTGSSGLMEISRSRILRFTAAVLPTSLRFVTKTRHTFSAVVYGSRDNLTWDFAVTASLLTGKFVFGALADSVASAAYTAANTGTFTLTIGTALASGAVQVSVNGGGYSTVIAAGNTSGTFAATSGDTINIRHTQSGSTDSQTFVQLTFGGVIKAFGVAVY